MGRRTPRDGVRDGHVARTARTVTDSVSLFIEGDLRDLPFEGRAAGGCAVHPRIDVEANVGKRTLAIQYLHATERDGESIAALHAESWRRHYRGAYSDSYLDGDVLTDRQMVWRSRLAQPTTGHFTVVARRGDEVLGFAHTVVDEDPQWGSLLENLHVTSDLKRTGIGTLLLSHTAQNLIRLRPEGSLHLWVLDQNTAAQAFYEARGGRRVETQRRGPFPGGGGAMGHRYHWSDPTRLLLGP
jgi:ribosomal protein S18 acetylase RimI-like enzyme